MNRIVILCLSLALAGCVKEAAVDTTAAGQPAFVFTADEIRLLAMLDEPTTLGTDTTERLIGEAIDLLEVHSEQTRTSPAQPSRSVASIRPLRTTNGAATRGDSRQETSMFDVVDFQDSLGYCIIAADSRIPEQIVCFVPDGSFPHADAASGIATGMHSTDNPGLRLMLDAIENYAVRSVGSHDAWCDSVGTALLARSGASSLRALRDSLAASTRNAETGSDGSDGPVYVAVRPSWAFHRRIAPMTPVEWSQKSPFNATVVANTEWKGTPVGCVALAAVGIMAYWGHPTSYHELDGGTIDWDELTRWSGDRWNRATRYRDWNGNMSSAPEETRNLVADLLWHVGQDVGMNYGSSVSLAYTRRAAELLASVGFSQSEATTYTKEVVVGSLEAARPLIIEGASHKIASENSYANSHAWIVDGYIEQRWWDCYRIDHHLYEVEQFRGFFHNNFGWGGSDNGYYACGVFDTNSAPDFTSDTRVEWIGEHYNYQFNLRVFPNIHRISGVK